MPIIPPYTPELLPAVQNLLAEPGHGRTLLEYGSGWSTVWWARLGWRVTTVEASREWADEVLKVTEGVRLLFHPFVLALPVKKEFDIVFVDGVDQHRPFYIERAPVNVKVGGAMVIDDCHWDLVRPSIERVLATELFEREWTVGGMHLRKTGERKYHETTLLRRIK